MRKMKEEYRGRIGQALLLLAALLLMVMKNSMNAEAAQLQSASVVVYEAADADSTPVGNLMEGNTFEVLGSVSAEDGSRWYAVSMSSGVNGYIKGSAVFTENGDEAGANTGEDAGDGADNRADDDAAGNAADNRADDDAADNRTDNDAAGDGADNRTGDEADNEIGDSPEDEEMADASEGDAAGEWKAREIPENRQEKTYALNATADRITAGGQQVAPDGKAGEDGSSFEAETAGSRQGAWKNAWISRMLQGLDVPLLCMLAAMLAALLGIRLCMRRLSGLTGQPGSEGRSVKKAWWKSRDTKKRKKAKQTKKKVSVKEEKKWKSNSRVQK